MTALFVEILVFVFGAAVGSFLNVCIYRLPAEQSIVRPGSRCPHCLTPIRWYDNLPLLSFLILRGRCRACAAAISWRYPAVEGLTALLALLLFWKYGPGAAFFAAFAFTAALIAVTFIDIDHQIIPDVISLPGIPIGFLLAVFAMRLPWLEALLGLLLGGGVLYAIAVAYELATKREGMGGGDIKLLAMIGAFLGWKSLIFILLVSSLTGAAVGIALMVAKGADTKYAVPFGPFLSLAAVAYLFFGAAFFNFLMFHRLF
ncbi:MAG TPA: prepilin peptidase [Syntrophus sp. (in: bacteria)]|jgi:leader peptidase (prepilin peptidase)/N-methyltransferase|nr:prepilin peptidase [Syntrophus sp. (in: bacteria)]